MKTPAAHPSTPLAEHPEQNSAQAQRAPERSLVWTEVAVWQDGAATTEQDALATEEPLEILLRDADGKSHPLAVTMRTPGHDLELAAGFLLTEGILDSADDLLSLVTATPDAQLAPQSARNRVLAALRNVDGETLARSQRNFFANSSCGVCGKATIAALRHRCLRVASFSTTLPSSLLAELPARLHAAQTIFSQTGGLHGAALFDPSGQLLVLREDIGRHNAVDKVVGWAMRNERLPLGDAILLVSGRCGFEIAQKALVAGIPILASISAPSSLAVQLAREFQLTLVGFLRAQRFVVYSGADRCR